MIESYVMAKKSWEGVAACSFTIFSTLFLTGPPFGVAIVVFIIGGIVATVVLRKEYIYSIEIDHDKHVATFITRSRISEEKDVYPISQIYFTYRKRTDYYSFWN